MLSRRVSLSLLALLCVVMMGEVAYYYWREHQPRENPYDPIIASVARDAGIDPFLIRALIWRESRFNPLTHGMADERGLMQIKPEVGGMWAKATKDADYKDDGLYNPTINIQVGTWYLNRAIKRWSQAQVDDPVPFALAEYNAGRSNALKWVDPDNPRDHTAFMNRITFPSTRKYVDVILFKRAEYRAVLADNRWYRDFATANPSMTLTP